MTMKMKITICTDFSGVKNLTIKNGDITELINALNTLLISPKNTVIRIENARNLDKFTVIDIKSFMGIPHEEIFKPAKWVIHPTTGNILSVLSIMHLKYNKKSNSFLTKTNDKFSNTLKISDYKNGNCYILLFSDRNGMVEILYDVTEKEFINYSPFSDLFYDTIDWTNVDPEIGVEQLP